MLCQSAIIMATEKTWEELLKEAEREEKEWDDMWDERTRHWKYKKYNQVKANDRSNLQHLLLNRSPNAKKYIAASEVSTDSMKLCLFVCVFFIFTFTHTHHQQNL